MTDSLLLPSLGRQQKSWYRDYHPCLSCARISGTVKVHFTTQFIAQKPSGSSEIIEQPEEVAGGVLPHRSGLKNTLDDIGELNYYKGWFINWEQNISLWNLH